MQTFCGASILEGAQNPAEQGPEQAVLFAPASSMEAWKQQTHRGPFQPQLYCDSVKSILRIYYGFHIY